MSKKLLFKGGHATGMTPYEIEDFSSLHIRDPRIDKKTKAYIDSVIGNSVLNLCPYRNVLVTHKYDTVEGNVVTLDDCQDDEIIQLSEIQGNTMVNCNKDTDKELILMPNLETNGYSNITLTEGIDGGKVDVALEGNTMVNVCDQEDPIAITKSYTVETGNHIALQGEYDGKCRPNIYGNTLVNLCTVENSNVNGTFKRQLAYPVSSTITIICHNLKDFKIAYSKEQDGKWIGNTIISGYKNVITLDSGVTVNELIAGNTEDYNNITYEEFQNLNIVVLEGDYTNKPIPDYFTGMKSSFEDKLVPENLASDVLYNGAINKQYTNLSRVSSSKLKRNTKYTTFIKNDSEESIKVYSDNTGGNFRYEQITIPAKSSKVATIITKDEELSATKNTWLSLDSNETLPQNISVYLVEGDYTNYDFTNYDSTKGGKYKVDYKVTGKNKCPRCTTTSASHNGITLTYDATTQTFSYSGTATNTSSYLNLKCPNFKLLKDKSYLFSVDNPLNDFYLQITEFNVGYNCNLRPNTTTTPIINLDKYTPNAIMLYSQNLTIGQSYSGTFKVMIEEGTTATTYEPYKESIKTLYLNSPLLEGDTIEQSGNNIIHNHRYGKVVLDGSNYVPSSEQTLSSVGNYRWRFYISDVKNSTSTTGLGICDKYPIVSPTETWNSIEGITQNNDGNKIVLYLDKYKDGSDVSKQALINELSANPITFIYKKSTPTQEIISTNDNLLLDSYTNGHLDVDTVVPIDKVVFVRPQLKLKYLYPNTEYIIQFESDSIGTTRIGLSGTLIYNGEVTKGINKVTATIESSGVHSDLFFNGIGFNASKIVVTPKVDNNFGYFKGMKSVGECESNKIEILSQNKNLLPILNLEVDNEGYANRQKTYWQNVKLKPNTKYTLSYINKTINNTNSDMWAVWVREQVGKKAVTTDNIVASTQTEISTSFTTSDKDLYEVSIISNNGDDVGSYLFKPNTVILEEGEKTSYVPYAMNKKEILLNEPLRGLPNGVKDKYVIIDDKWYIERNCGKYVSTGNEEVYTYLSTDNNVVSYIILNDYFNTVGSDIICDKELTTVQGWSGYHKGISAIRVNNENRLILSQYNTEQCKTLLKQQSTFIYELQTPTYESIDYNPFEVYTDTTHISNNSTIPCNMVVKNTGYNCILKPNTTYTVSSSNGLSTVTTKDSIGDSVLRFYNKDTSSITKMNNVLVLEGDYITGNPPIPAFFEGMESAFEQEYDEEKNKYKVNVKVTDGNKENNITFYINEPLRGVGDIKDKVYVKEDKVVVERNCSSATLDGSDDESWQAPSNANYKYGVFTLHLPLNHKNVKVDDKNEQGAICNTLIPYWWWTNKDSFETVPDNSIHYLTWENTNTFYIIKKNLRTVDEIKQWLKSNKTEYIYPLKTPTYEEVECDLSKLALEGYNHGTLFYNSNIPVTTQFYDFNVNIKDMLIPNETYYITFIADRVKDITINLSGVQVNYKTSMGYNKVPVQLGDVVNTNFSMDSRGVELSDLMISTSTSLIYVKDMNDVCIYDEANNKYSITITSTGGNESDKRVILLDYPLLRLNKDVYDRLYYNNKDSRYRIDKKVFKHKFTNDREYNKYAAETNDTYYSSFISLNETIKDYVVITNEKVKTVKVEDDKYYFKIKWSDLGVSDKTEVNGNQGMKDFFNNNEVHLYYATDGFVEIVDGLRRQTLKMYQPETTINFLGNTTTTVTIIIPKKNI